MSIVKRIQVRTITPQRANLFIAKHHYSGKYVQNSQVHFGAFLDGSLHGVLQFGPSMDKSKIQGLVRDTGWNEFIELNRMAFDEALPKNSESRVIGICLRILKKKAAHLKWVVSFADGAQCGDGTIYRASGFYLTGLTKNNTLFEFPNGERIAGMTLEANWNLPQIKRLCESMGVPHIYRTRTDWKRFGAKPIPGNMMRYIFFIDKSYKERLTVPIIPFKKIDDLGAGMYKGERVSLAERSQEPFVSSLPQPLPVATA